MADFAELIFTEEFKAYQKKEIELIVKHVHQLLETNRNPEVLRGVLQLASKIIRLPAELDHNASHAEQLAKRVEQNLIDISTSLLREYLKEF